MSNDDQIGISDEVYENIKRQNGILRHLVGECKRHEQGNCELDPVECALKEMTDE